LHVEKRLEIFDVECIQRTELCTARWSS